MHVFLLWIKKKIAKNSHFRVNKRLISEFIRNEAFLFISDNGFDNEAIYFR